MIHPPPTRGLPAKPLADKIDLIIARSTDHQRTLEALGVHARNLLDWRTKPGTAVQHGVADRVISSSPYLWFDVWTECPTHRYPSRTCATCYAHCKARSLFTPALLPAIYRPSRKPRTRRKRVTAAPRAERVQIEYATCRNPACGEELPMWALTFCADCRAATASVRQTLSEGMWAQDWALSEMADVLGVGVAYFSGRRLRNGWDLPYRYERHALAVAA